MTMVARIGYLLLLCSGIGLCIPAQSATLSPMVSYLRQQQLRDQLAQTYGSTALKRIDQLIDMLQHQESSNDRRKLESVNNYFNQLIYETDRRLWGKDDYWAKPLEFIGAHAGDCEDYSLGKYYTLMELGLKEEQLRLVYVKAVTYNQFHMVPAYYPTLKSEPLILDNIKAAIYPASRRPDLLPVYSFNARNLWVMNQRKEGQLIGNADRLTLWSDLRNRMGDNNFKVPRAKL